MKETRNAICERARIKKLQDERMASHITYRLWQQRQHQNSQSQNRQCQHRQRQNRQRQSHSRRNASVNSPIYSKRQSQSCRNPIACSNCTAAAATSVVLLAAATIIAAAATIVAADNAHSKDDRDSQRGRCDVLDSSTGCWEKCWARVAWRAGARSACYDTARRSTSMSVPSLISKLQA